MRPWHSFLFVPADNRRMLERSGNRGADVVIADLEDAVSLEHKPAARELLATVLPQLRGSGSAIGLRVDPRDDLAADLAVAVQAGVDLVMMPKAESVDKLGLADDILRNLEKDVSAPLGRTRLAALIETPRGVMHMAAGATAPRGCTGLRQRGLQHRDGRPTY